jgi:hypothetical protein
MVDERTVVGARKAALAKGRRMRAFIVGYLGLRVSALRRGSNWRYRAERTYWTRFLWPGKMSRDGVAVEASMSCWSYRRQKLESCGRQMPCHVGHGLAVGNPCHRFLQHHNYPSSLPWARMSTTLLYPPLVCLNQCILIRELDAFITAQ